MAINLSAFADGHEARLEAEGDYGPEEKAARIEADDGINLKRDKRSFIW